MFRESYLPYPGASLHTGPYVLTICKHNYNYNYDDVKYRSNFPAFLNYTNSNHKIAYGDHGRLPKCDPADIHKSNNFITFHQNIRGLTRKTDQLLISLSCSNPQVLCVTEHHLRPDEINNVHLGHYTLGTHYCRKLYKQGGVAIFVSKHLEFQKIDLNQHVKEKDLEVCALNP
jgi:hypothetical protein